MKIDSIFISGFRCFSVEGQPVNFNDITCFVGPNASGKTATMAALAKMFGETQAERVIRSSDFHLMPGEKLDTQDERHLLLEIKLAFPELNGDKPNGDAIPEGFNQMVVDEPQATPYCRIRLDATWTNDGTPTGDVQQKLSWILTPSDDPEVIEQNRRVVKSNERARIRVVYIPATRDPSQQIRSTTASVFGRLLRAIDWAGKDEEVRRHLSDLKSELGQLQGIGSHQTLLTRFLFIAPCIRGTLPRQGSLLPGRHCRIPGCHTAMPFTSIGLGMGLEEPLRIGYAHRTL